MEACLVVHTNGLIERRDKRDDKVKPIKTYKKKNGYVYVRVENSQIPIQKIVAMCYLGYKINDMRDIFHINHNSTDNSVTNLKLA